jgi:cell division protein FtsW
LGKTINNATRWIELLNGRITIMPGEIVKSSMILFFAWLYAKSRDYAVKFKWVAFALLIAAAAFFLIYKQPNLSTALIVVALIFGMMFLAGLPIIYLLAIGVLAVVGLAFLLLFKGGYMMERVTSFMRPFDDALGSGYQVCQGLLAMGSGGVFGVGLGNSIQKAFYLPEAQSDFILAIIGEELGFVGIMVLLIAYLALVYLLFSVSIRAKDRFGMLLAGGVALHLGLQVILNVAVVTATAPPTGVVLPLVSAGGNALILYMAELGIVYNVSKQARFTDEEITEEGSEK